MRAIAHLASAALVLSLAACDDRREPKIVEDVESDANEAGEAIDDGAREARDEVEAAGRDLADYGYAQRDDFRSEVHRHVAELDEEIAELGRDTGGAAGTVSADAMRGIRSAREALDQSLGRIDESTEEGWAELRTDVQQSMTRVREVIAEVRRTEGPMGGRGAGQS